MSWVCLEQARSGMKVLDLLDMAIDGTREWSLQGIDSRLRAIIMKSTEPKIENRYATMRELALDLRLFLRDKAVHAFQEPLLMTWWRKFESIRLSWHWLLVVCLQLVVRLR